MKKGTEGICESLKHIGGALAVGLLTVLFSVVALPAILIVEGIKAVGGKKERGFVARSDSYYDSFGYYD